MDLLVASTAGPPVVLRNNGDGSWRTITPFREVSAVRGCIWAAVTGGGAPDIALLDAMGRAVVYQPKRPSRYRRVTVPAPAGGAVLALSAADVRRRGRLDLVALVANGSIVRMTYRPETETWESAEIARWQAAPRDGSARLMWADLDNNGGVDLVATGSAGTAVWLSDEHGSLLPPIALAARSVTLCAPNGEGRIDLLGTTAAGQHERLVNRGAKPYSWLDLQPRAQYMPREAYAGEWNEYRVSTFVAGGRIALRASAGFQAQPNLGPTVHFGLGDYQAAEDAVLAWPTGVTITRYPDTYGGSLAARTRSEVMQLFAG
jgi:hypothetical protein